MTGYGILTTSTIDRSLESMTRPTTDQTGFLPSGIRPLSAGCEAVVYTIVNRVQNYGEPGHTLRGAPSDLLRGRQ